MSTSTHRTSVAVRVCPSVSVSTHRTSVAVCVCPSVSVSIHRTSVAVPQYTYQHVGRPWLFVAVRQHTHDVRGCPSAHTGRLWVFVSTHRTSMAVRVCPSAHTGRSWLTHISTLVLGLRTLTLLVDCSGDFGPRGLSVQYTQDVRGCPPAHTGRPWLPVCVRQHTQDVRDCPSVHISARWPFWWNVWVILSQVGCLFSTHRTSMGVRQHTQDVWGCVWLSASTHRTSGAVCGCLSAHPGRSWVSVSTHRTFVCVRKHTQDVRGCTCVSVSTHKTSVAVHQYTYQHVVHTGRPWVSASTHRTSHTGCLWRSVCVRVCPSAHTGRTWLSISIHISKLVLGLSTLAVPMDCLGDFGPRGLSVQYTQDVCGCPSARTGHPCVSVSTNRTFVAVRVCPCVFVSTHMTSVAVHQYTYQHVSPLTPHADPSCGLFGTSVAVRVCPSVSVSTHRTSVAVPQYTYQQYTQDIHGCPPAHTGRPGLFVAVCQHTQDIRVCPCVSVSTHRTFVGVAQTGRLWLSISTHISTLVLELCTLALPVDCLGDFGPRGLSVQYTQDVRGCPPAHTGRPWRMLALPVDGLGDFGPRGLSVQYTQNVCGCPSAHTGRPCVSISTHRRFVAVRVCPCVSVSTHMTFVAVHQYTYQHVGPLTPHADPSCGLFGTSWLSVCVHLCPSAHTGRPWLSLSTHISTLVLGLSTLALPVDCLGDFIPRGLSVQYTQDVRGCPPAHTGRPWLFVAVRQHTLVVRVCLCVSVSTHRTSVGVRQHTQNVRVCPTRINTLVLGLCTLALPVDCLGDFGPRGLSVQYTQDVRGCPPAHTGRPWLSLCVCVCPSAHTGRPWLSISTHISTLVVGLSTLTLLVDCSGDLGPRGLSVQYTQDVRGCPSAHTGRLCVSVSTHRTFVAVRVCPCVSVSTHMTSVAVHKYTYQHVGPLTPHADPSCGLFG
ncbi:hypothetical protein YC2023_108597 [Brassica napus]